MTNPRIKYRISVIIGIYNCAETLSEALDSLYAQTYQGFKIIMCDDGSNDETYKIAERYKNKYDNVILLKNKGNKGLNYTLNKCLEHVDTEYVARMDGDDISLPERFQIQLDFLDNNPEFAFVSSPMIYFDENGDFKTGTAIFKPNKYHFVKGAPFCHAPSLLRKKAFDAVGGYSVSKKLLRVEDYHLWFKLYSKGFKGANIEKPLYKMRDDRNAFSRRKFRYRVNEMRVKSVGFKMLGLPFYYHLFSLRPILIGLLPYKIYNFFRKSLNTDSYI